MDINEFGTIHNGFGESIRALRIKSGMSLHDLSEKTGISSSYIVRIENGQIKKPSFSVIECLLQGLGIKTSILLQRLESKKHSN
ncbi:helix-turn-helix transcriptional regulator [Brevibacillus borstelensis]|uniref:helix-turn-helix domain-containing protein n=1 Tax=Brevibacillus borstelensis TaxID=45462 RepID=UPI0030F56A24